MDKKKVKELIGKAKDYILAYQKNGKNSDLALAFLNMQNADRELSKSDWVSVEDELPPYGEDVNVRINNGVFISYRSTYRREPSKPVITDIGKETDEHDFVKYDIHQYITHWQYPNRMEGE